MSRLQTSFDARIFSGIQPTGSLHIGNYLGALKRFVSLQHEMPALYCIVDLHALTLAHDPHTLRRDVRGVAAAYIAAGIDAERAIVFSQSAVRAHAELAWVFMCVARMGWLGRMTQFKDKAGKDRENASVGLFAYPALMAADILLYRATHVPVGDDQKQHLELTRDIAQKFNGDFQGRIRQLDSAVRLADGSAACFPLAEPLIGTTAHRVMSLRDGRRKMSKSDASDFSRINLDDPAELIAQKIRKARTDPQPLPGDEEGLADRPEADNLVGIYAGFADLTKAAVLREFGGAPFARFKPALAELMIDKLAPVGQQMRELARDTALIDRILEEGAARARAIADPVMCDVRQIVGL